MKEIVNSCLSTKRFISEIPKYNHEVKNSDLRKKKKTTGQYHYCTVIIVTVKLF